MFRIWIQCIPQGDVPIKIMGSVGLSSLAPGRCPEIIRKIIFKCKSLLVYLMILLWNWFGLDAKVLKSILIQVMAWCHQATSHNLSQCWPRSLSPYGVTRPQSVKGMAIPIIKLGESFDRPNFIMEIPIPLRPVLLSQYSRYRAHESVWSELGILVSLLMWALINMKDVISSV